LEETESSNYLRTKDFLVSGESFDLVYDASKDMLFTTPKPGVDSLGSYYESDAYISHTDSKNGIMEVLYQRIKIVALKQKLRLISRLNSGKGTLADIGAGTGAFLASAAQAGWSIQGVEPNEKARSFAAQRRIQLQKELRELEGNQFDVVTLWHVLEHLPDLEADVAMLKKLVKPGGHLIIAVPNFKSFDARFYKSYWAAYDVPRHLWHFSRKAMEVLFSDQLKLVTVKPMLFDSFYVSLLSEKYKSGNTFSIKAIIIGLWSNIRGWFTGEYSSHIYCFKKPF
jgi:SAM-dependent methyltransferase